MKIQLSNGRHALISKCDFNKIAFKKKYKYQKNKIYVWHEKIVNKRISYAVCHKLINGVWKTIRMHRLILNLENDKKYKVDHINGNGLDNRRKNLRICSQSNNTKNRVGLYKSNTKGVTFCNGKWKAQITNNYKTYHLGRFKFKKYAMIAYNKAAIKLHKNFAKLNEI